MVRRGRRRRSRGEHDGKRKLKRGYDPNQPRDPHTGEWTDGPGGGTLVVDNLEAGLKALRSGMARRAQAVYDAWENEGDDPEYGAGGICDEIASEIGWEIAESMENVEITDGGWEGDDHAWVVVHGDDGNAYSVDIPYDTYESGAGYDWHKIPDVQFGPDDVVISPLGKIDEMEGFAPREY